MHSLTKRHSPVGVGIQFLTISQGSSSLATLGWRTQSLWDCRSARGLTLLASIVALVCSCFTAAAEPAFQVPSGFAIERAAGPPEISFPMFATLDDKGRLYVTGSSGGDLYDELQKLTRSCRISVLEDRDSDGRYEISCIFADKLTPSMGLVWRDGKLYAADPPDLVTLQDTDGDGRADKRAVVLTGFGH